MPQQGITSLLAARPWLLADGATGTNLFLAGLQHGDAPELWNLTNQVPVRDLVRSFVDAGADIVLTNTFGGTAQRLKLHEAQNRVVEINRAAAGLAREVADAAGRPVLVAGSMGPTGELFEPLGPLTVAEGTAAFAEQAEGLAAGGCDLLWIETMSSIDELTAAVRGAASSGLPAVCTMSFDTNGCSMMGVTPSQIAGMMGQLESRPVAYGANCGVGAAELVATIVSMAEAAAPDDVIIAKSNCGIPEFVEDEIHYTGTPELMADYATLALDSGARIIGGCCGTTDKHLRYMREALTGHTKGEKPKVEDLMERLGPISRGAQNLFAKAPLGEKPEARERGARRGRRRAARDKAPSF